MTDTHSMTVALLCVCRATELMSLFSVKERFWNWVGHLDDANRDFISLLIF